MATLAALAAGSALLLTAHRPAYAQTPPAPPAPSNVGTGVPLPYNGADAAQVNPPLIGPLQLLRSGKMDLSDPDAPTIRIPLYLGHLKSGAKRERSGEAAGAELD